VTQLAVAAATVADVNFRLTLVTAILERVARPYIEIRKSIDG
jgi:hypothetical protein